MSHKKGTQKSYETENPEICYVMDHSLRQHPVQKELIETTLRDFPVYSGMMGAPEVLQLLSNLIQMMGAKKYLDVGVFTGASSLAAALALPEDGKVIACDVSEEFTNVAKTFWKKAGVENKIVLKLQPAVESLDELIAGGQNGTFDLAFIDADKENYENYYERCLVLLKKGGIVAIDNVIWSGRVYDETKQDSSTVAIRALNKKVHKDDRVNVSMLTIGDGLTLAFKK